MACKGGVALFPFVSSPSPSHSVSPEVWREPQNVSDYFFKKTRVINQPARFTLDSIRKKSAVIN